MAIRLGGRVVCGELRNTANYAVHGWLRLQDAEHPLMLELTGNCSPDLVGWHIRFETRDCESESEQTTQLAQTDLPDMALQQVGPTGTITAARKVKVFDCPIEEAYIRCKLDEPPPMEWKRLLYIEWFGQNGRVVVELADPIIEFVEFKALEGESEDGQPAKQETLPDQESQPPQTGLGITSIRLDEHGNAEIDEEVLSSSQDETEAAENDESDDPYRLIPEELEQQFEAQAEETDLKLQFEADDEDKPRSLRELELMDDLIENGSGVTFSEIFEGPLQLPPPETVDDAEAEEALKAVLSQLAIFGISLHICDHFTPRDAYRLLLEEICPDARAYPELRNTQWVQCFSTSDYCEACEAEFEREYEEEEQRRRKEHPEQFKSPDDPPTDDEFPF